MGILSNFRSRVAAGAQGFRFQQMGGDYGLNDPWGGLWRMLSGSTFDYRREAGILWENSICMAGIRWVWRSFPRARVCVKRPTGKMLENGQPEYVEVQDHPLTALWNRPNPFYSKSTLWKGMLLSYMVDGNSHTYINRSAADIPVELYYVPFFQISPRWMSDNTTQPTFEESTNYLDHWEYRVDGDNKKWKPTAVFHWRDGIDPQNQRRGLSPLTATLREVAGDNCMATVSAAICRNNNIPGLIVSTKPNKQGGAVELTDVQAEKLKTMGQQKFSGDRAGEMLVSTVPLEVSRLAFNPKEMDFSANRAINEERVMAQWGIPLVLAGLGAGLDVSKVGATMKVFERMGYDQCLIPMWGELAEELTFWGKREFGAWMQDDERVEFDTSGIPALQDDVKELHDRVNKDFESDLLKRSEARAIYGMKSGPEDEVYYSQVAGRMPTGSSIEPIPNDGHLNEEEVPDVVKPKQENEQE